MGRLRLHPALPLRTQPQMRGETEAAVVAWTCQPQQFLGMPLLQSVVVDRPRRQLEMQRLSFASDKYERLPG
jgi:hypothetical protein